MKRFHVHVNVADLGDSIRFYTALFGEPPTVTKSDYAKWMLEDPRINFAVSLRGKRKGLDHVGLQASDETDFASLRERVETADASVFEQPDVACCYARSSKAWIRDPDGLVWENFLTSGDEPDYGVSALTGFEDSAATGTGCCG